MPSHCCVVDCRSNYDSDIKETYQVFSFPAENDPDRSRKEWYDSLPNVIIDTTGKKICIRHWPENYETVKRKGHLVPAKPPSVWPVPQSCCRCFDEQKYASHGQMWHILNVKTTSAGHLFIKWPRQRANKRSEWWEIVFSVWTWAMLQRDEERLHT